MSAFLVDQHHSLIFLQHIGFRSAKVGMGILQGTDNYKEEGREMLTRTHTNYAAQKFPPCAINFRNGPHLSTYMHKII